jgi:hypothetical protein
MASYNDAYGTLPGVGSTYETFESAFCWGPAPPIFIVGGVINANTTDTGDNPTFELRPGLVLGQITSSAQWYEYTPTNSDGSQIASGVLTGSLRQETITGTPQTTFYGIMVGGGVIAANLYGLDYQAREQMRGRFIFDDDYPGFFTNPWLTMIGKTASYALLNTDNGTQFSNSGATGAITFTLPAIANGYSFGFFCAANQAITISSNEGSNIIAENNASASNIAISTAGDILGGSLRFYSNPGATKWHMDKLCGNALTIT